MATQTEKLQSRAEIDEEYVEGLDRVARLMHDNPHQREVLEQFVSGEIHNKFGGSIKQQYGWGTEPYVFWHNHGIFVGPDGAIYEARTDDNGVPQVYVSPNDPEWTTLDCITPWTYDVTSGPYYIEMRFDFINGPHRTAPRNTIEEAVLQRADGKDPVYPRHYEGIDPSSELSRRDSLALIKRGNGHVDGWLHDCETDEFSRLYSPQDVLAVARSLDDIEVEHKQLITEHDKGRESDIDARIGANACRSVR